ncbi:hypothetical protein F4678DRAFT_446243 [Xylaria arbuscula]|nr:hypothetical protein F4678DRAFT_446243 [Xylaria arbuscula]
MAYRGKPSTACERCRSRRLKCDHGIPTCTQCIRAGVCCPGYRNLLDLNFLDQSEEVARLYRPSMRKKHQKTSIAILPCDDTAAAITSIPRSPSLHSVRDLAKRHSYVGYMTGGSCYGHMSYLVCLIEDPGNKGVNTALDAVALAALSNVRLSPQILLKAQRQYTTALSQTNRALKDPIMCKTDDTLAAVVLLGTYEVITCTDYSYIDRWMKHMDGAAKLIEIRGSNQLTRREGLDMFTHLRAQISLSSIYQEKYISPALAQLTEEAKQYRDPNDMILDDLSTIVIQLANFCADVKNIHIVEPAEIIRTALGIDADLVSLLISVPPSWSYTTVQVPIIDGNFITKAIWGSHYHVYNSIAAASMWNNYRSARIVVQELILDTLRNLELYWPDNTPYFQQNNLVDHCQQTILQLAEDICASAPFHFGLGIENETLQKSSSGSVCASDGTAALVTQPQSLGICSSPSAISNTYDMASSSSIDARHIPRKAEPNAGLSGHTSDHFEVVGAGGLTLMWPLLVAANSGVASKDLREWVVSYLDKIGHSMGINQALAMAKLIREGMGTRAWLSPDYQSSSDST